MAYNSQPNQYQISMPNGGYRAPSYQPWTGVQQTPLPIIRPVTSLEEVRACPIDFDGSIFYFTDVANKRIYTKQVGMDGAPIVKLYEQKEIEPVVAPTTINYVTKEEFEDTIRQLITKYESIIKMESPEQTKKPLFEI